MKILAIGDFHGKFPKKLLKLARKKDIDLIISPGDFCGNEKLNKLFFKYVYGTDNELWEFIGKRKYNELIKKNFNSGVRIIKKLASIKKPIIGVRGNWDPVTIGEIGFSNENDPYAGKFLQKARKLGIKIIDFKNTKFENYNFIGYPRSTYPGKATLKIQKKLEVRDKKNVSKIIRKIKKDNKKYFQKFKEKFNENTIFISHNSPYKTKLDKVKKGPQKGKHYGSWLTKKIIKELKPELVICGHMHENQGKQILGKTLIVNTGAANKGKAAIIEIPEMKVKFVK